MPSIRYNTRRRALTFSRSLARIFKPRFSFTFFSRHNAQPVPVPVQMQQPIVFIPPHPGHISHSGHISRPRPLRRPPPTYTPIQIFQPHPIYRLPVELISLIFVSGSEDDPDFAIVVSHVCRAWRHIALQTPSLWRRITLNTKEHMWRERIRRARACSLDIQLLPWSTPRTGVPRARELNLYTVQWYMHIVLPYISRWRSLEIVFAEYAPYLWKATLASCVAPATALQDLSLVYRLNDDTEEFTLFSGSAPRLRRVTLDGIRLRWLPSLFANLRFLDYTHHGFTSGHQAVDDVISILTVSSRLSELRLLFPRGQKARLPPRRDYVTKRIRLPYLTDLHLIVDGSDIPFELAHIVTLISTPRLSSLHLIDLRYAHHSFHSLKSFFYVYALPSALRFIHISHGWYDPRMIPPMAQSLSRLQRIMIKRSRVPEHVLYVNNHLRRTHWHKGSTHRTHGQNSHRHGSTTIDRFNVHYFPGYYQGQ
ncbi:hypothetical protein B0H34DRAFT_708192 [Crassisporium funariophilum]|nr:hypothetical protein B0H34DRAFT_708192 [Crassisporium funariophilum]